MDTEVSFNVPHFQELTENNEVFPDTLELYLRACSIIAFFLWSNMDCRSDADLENLPPRLPGPCSLKMEIYSPTFPTQIISHLKFLLLSKRIWDFELQWWFFKPDTFVPGQYFRIYEFSRLLNRPLVWMWKSVPALFVWISEIFYGFWKKT